MQLLGLLDALSQNSNLYITIKDEDGNTLITFDAAGYESVENDLGTRAVKEVNVVSSKAATIIIENGDTPTPSGDSAFDYSTEVKAVGSWVDGKTLYQVSRVLQNELTVNAMFTYVPEFSDITDLENVVSCEVWAGMKSPDIYFATDSSWELGRIGVCIRTNSLDTTVTLQAGTVITIRYYKLPE